MDFHISNIHIYLNKLYIFQDMKYIQYLSKLLMMDMLKDNHSYINKYSLDIKNNNDQYRHKCLWDIIMYIDY